MVIVKKVDKTNPHQFIECDKVNRGQKLLSDEVSICSQIEECAPQFKIKELVINWHVTEGCNYSCDYCYAKWNKPKNNRDLIFDKDKTKNLLKEISKYFDSENKSNPLQNSMKWDSIRLNIAGGEPLLYPNKVLFVAQEARKLGMKVSIITNGSFLTSDLIKLLAPELSMLGLSIDSSMSDSNLKIGRADKNNEQLSINNLDEIVSEGRRINPDLKIKINTVVNSVNYGEDMLPVIELIKPDRWKVFKMLPIVSSDLMVSQDDFYTYIKRHQNDGVNISAEDNNDMTESYIMIDPKGRFFQNSIGKDKDYDYSDPILEVGVSGAFSSIGFKSVKFTSRYDLNEEQ